MRRYCSRVFAFVVWLRSPPDSRSRVDPLARARRTRRPRWLHRTVFKIGALRNFSQADLTWRAALRRLQWISQRPFARVRSTLLLMAGLFNVLACRAPGSAKGAKAVMPHPTFTLLAAILLPWHAMVEDRAPRKRLYVRLACSSAVC